MAARKSGSDAHNGPISYLDDVPFKINERFRCPAKVGLPVGFCLPHCDSLLADTQYDFLLERRSVLWGNELAEARAAEARAQEMAAAKPEAESTESFTKSHDVDGSSRNRTRTAAEDQDLPPPALNPVLAGLSHNAILTPLPAPSLGPRNTQPSIPQQHSLNLADFEREEDPFDKLELKTIDDKEELRSILQSQPQLRPSVSPPESSELGSASRGNSPSPPSSHISFSVKPACAHKPNGLVALVDMERVGQPGRVGADTDDRPCNIRSLTFPKLLDSSEPESVTVRYSAIPAPIPTLQNNRTNGSPPTIHKSHVIVAPEPASRTKNGAPKLANSGSGSALPCGGALLSMTPSERQCVETLVGMGYSYEGVLRAMQRQGQNMEQVLDYLFVHGRLCERGFDATAVEECLEMYQCSEEKALQFLELMSRFGEMGFEREAIKEVLLFHSNDQDKALEELMARAAAS
ncbi:ubiquitin-associated protein 1 isoform X2 [Thalassophryne amazonica]|uniref:ubiquitin-associated protein 1 isoform X2 n=1 Tax=Thalassophryne amazonica TaxID=390379 RepID=UPI00147106AA|nr:ubiquitin-associated protein 1 isoform X2 [Thalassophryne amazonica]